MTTQTAFNGYRVFLEGLTTDSIGELDLYVSEDVIFRDPLHDVAGSKAMQNLFTRLFDRVTSIDFRVDSHAVHDNLVFFRWSIAGTLSGSPWSVEGVTRLTFNSDGKVVEQVEYWDVASQLYERFPIIGPLLRRLRARVARD